MVVGPFARVLAQVVVPLVAVVARALPAAYAQALANARRSGTAATATSVLRRNAISTSEAGDILNVNAESATVEEIDEKFKKYMEANKVTKEGGSFYLQSKVYRAHELLKEFQAEKAKAQQQSGQ